MAAPRKAKKPASKKPVKARAAVVSDRSELDDLNSDPINSIWDNKQTTRKKKSSTIQPPQDPEGVETETTYANFRVGSVPDLEEETPAQMDCWYKPVQEIHSRSKFKPEYVRQGRILATYGATEQEIADFFGVPRMRIFMWSTKYPEFAKAIKMGREQPDEAVVKSLYHRARGYSYDAVKVFMPAGAKEPVYAPYREHVPPDTTACIFWLKNRDRENWRDRWEVTGKDGAPLMSGNESVAAAIIGLLQGAGQFDGDKEQLPAIDKGQLVPVDSDN